MGLVCDLIVYAILFLVFIVRKESAKRISMLVAVIYAAVSCLAYIDANIWLLIVNALIGLVSAILILFLERKKPRKKEIKKSKTIAAILSFFFGSFGAHNFYLGRWFWACLYILFFWTLIPLYISMIECIVFLVLPKETFERIYLGKNLAKKPTNKIDSYVAEDKKDFESTCNCGEEDFSTDVIHYTDISLHKTENLRTANIEGTIEKFIIKIESESGPIHFCVENGIITSYYLENRRIYKQYGVK